MGRTAANLLARRVARKAWQSQRTFSKSAVSEQASGAGLARPDAQVSQRRAPYWGFRIHWLQLRSRRMASIIVRSHSANCVYDNYMQPLCGK